VDLLVVERIKKFTYYKLNKKTILPLMKLIDKHMGQFCIHILRNEEDAKWKTGKI